MSDGIYLGGVRSVSCLRDRCRIDEETGCWRWAYAKTDGLPRVHMIFDGKRITPTGRKAALMLAHGKPIQQGHVCFATRDCKHMDCVNPDHCRSSSRANWGQYLTSTGRARTPAKIATATANGRRQLAKLNWEQVREIRASDASNKDLAEAYGVTAKNVWAIRSGRIWKEGVPQASVFTFRPALKEAA